MVHCIYRPVSDTCLSKSVGGGVLHGADAPGAASLRGASGLLRGGPTSSRGGGPSRVHDGRVRVGGARLSGRGARVLRGAPPGAEGGAGEGGGPGSDHRVAPSWAFHR